MMKRRYPIFLVLASLLAPSAAWAASAGTWMTTVLGRSQWHEHIYTAALVGVSRM